MAIPDEGFSSTPVESTLLSPDNLPRLDTRLDFERGGIGLSDVSQGYNVRDWMVRTDGVEIWVAPWPEQTPRTVVYTGAEITEVSLAFDQNMGPTVAFVEAGTTKLRWYNSLSAAIEVTSFVEARSPMLTLDDKRLFASGTSDIIFAYIRSGQVRYRQQRDRFGVEYTLGATPSAGSRLVQLGMGENNRLQFKVTVVPQAVHADRITDTLYVLAGEDIVGVERGAVEAAVWRSKVFVTNEVPVLPWARIEGAYPVTFRLYADGAVVQTKTVADDEPFRLKALRCREWSVELSGTVRVQNVRLAQSIEELWQ